jgi:hypothetical protein
MNNTDEEALRELEEHEAENLYDSKEQQKIFFQYIANYI